MSGLWYLMKISKMLVRVELGGTHYSPQYMGDRAGQRQSWANLYKFEFIIAYIPSSKPVRDT